MPMYKDPILAPEEKTPFEKAKEEHATLFRAAERTAKKPMLLTVAIPPEVEQYAPEIRRFVEAMVYKLGVHSGKGKWENLPMSDVIPKLQGEVEELVEAVGRGNMVEVLLEAADVANYALIAASKAME